MPLSYKLKRKSLIIFPKNRGENFEFTLSFSARERFFKLLLSYIERLALFLEVCLQKIYYAFYLPNYSFKILFITSNYGKAIVSFASITYSCGNQPLSLSIPCKGQRTERLGKIQNILHKLLMIRTCQQLCLTYQKLKISYFSF